MFSYRYSKTDLPYLSECYNAAKSLLYLPFNQLSSTKNPLLNNLCFHPTRDSLDYALLLLDQNIRPKEIEAILFTIVKLQNQDIHSPNYGGWPKYLESTYFRAPGEYWKFDENWTEFIGLGLLEVLLNDAYRTRLDSSLIQGMISSVTHAAVATKQRNIRHFYTNIYVLGMCLTLLAGKTLSDKAIYQHGLDRLTELHINAISCSCFSEYNSPIYSFITFEALSYLKSALESISYDEKPVLNKVDELYNLAGREISNYFHSITGQWAGPHSRSYSALLDSRAENFIKNVAIDFGDQHQKEPQFQLPDGNLAQLQIPANPRQIFLVKEHSRTITREISHKKPSQILTTHLTSTFAIGTVNYSDLWCQRNSLLAYWGTNEDPCYLRLRCLHNDKDFSTAQFFSAQATGNILGAINFATDTCKENPYLPKSRAHRFGFPTYDLRIRFEFGNASRIPNFKILKESDSLLLFEVESMYFNFSVPYARFESTDLKWSISRDKKNLNLDMVLYSGFIKLIDFSRINPAVASFYMQILESIDDFVEQTASAEIVGDNLILTTKDLHLSVSSRPQGRYWSLKK
jgi:hypothetical protein